MKDPFHADGQTVMTNLKDTYRSFAKDDRLMDRNV